MIQHNLLETAPVFLFFIFLRKKERKKDIRLKGRHCLLCLSFWYHLIAFARILYLHSLRYRLPRILYLMARFTGRLGH